MQCFSSSSKKKEKKDYFRSKSQHIISLIVVIFWYLLVAKENEELKKELTYADYNATKERHEKLVRTPLVSSEIYFPVINSVPSQGVMYCHNYMTENN